MTAKLIKDPSFIRGLYKATTEELEGIDRGLKAAREGRFASDEEVAAVLAKHFHHAARGAPWNS
jgi:predicted transcriptional regulator